MSQQQTEIEIRKNELEYVLKEIRMQCQKTIDGADHADVLDDIVNTLEKRLENFKGCLGYLPEDISPEQELDIDDDF